jgi:hypothetical protein
MQNEEALLKVIMYVSMCLQHLVSTPRLLFILLAQYKNEVLR